MDDTTIRETHELVLEAIRHGRLLAQELHDAGLVPNGTAKRFILHLLDQLSDRRGMDEMDEERIQLIGDQIRFFTNTYLSGLGDRAIEGEVDTEHLSDVRAIDLVNVAWRWRQYRAAKRALDDKIASIRETENLLAQVLNSSCSPAPSADGK